MKQLNSQLLDEWNWEESEEEEEEESPERKAELDRAHEIELEEELEEERESICRREQYRAEHDGDWGDYAKDYMPIVPGRPRQISKWTWRDMHDDPSTRRKATCTSALC